MNQQEYEQIRTCPQQPDWPKPNTVEGICLLEFGAVGPFWPNLNGDGKWSEEFWVYVQDGNVQAPDSARVICIRADENIVITQQRVDAACAQLLVGNGTLVDYSVGDPLPNPEQE